MSQEKSQTRYNFYIEVGVGNFEVGNFEVVKLEWGDLSEANAKLLYRLTNNNIRNPLHSAQPTAFGWKEEK